MGGTLAVSFFLSNASQYFLFFTPISLPFLMISTYIHFRILQFFYIGNSQFILAGKLKALKMDLKKWNVEVFGNIVDHKNSLMEKLIAVEDGEEDEMALLRKKEVVSELERLLLMEEISWR